MPDLLERVNSLCHDTTKIAPVQLLFGFNLNEEGINQLNASANTQADKQNAARKRSYRTTSDMDHPVQQALIM